MKKRNIVAANWKMNPVSQEEAKEIFNATKKGAEKLRNTDVVVCPPDIFLQFISKIKRPKNMHLGSQDAFYENKGAFTGEVSSEMVYQSGASYSIIGHSEMRARGETNEIVNKKIKACFGSKITPIICIGERERDKDGAYLSMIKDQIKIGLSGLSKKDLVGLVIAYEPVWAIGKSYKEAMNPTDVHEMVLFIKKSISEFFGKDIAGSVRILYGGSVEAVNAGEIMQKGEIDGFLVGHASLDRKEFAEIMLSADIKR